MTNDSNALSIKPIGKKFCIKTFRSAKKGDCYCVCFLKLSMTGAPIVKLGTKCLHEIQRKRRRKGNMLNNLMVMHTHSQRAQ